MYARKRGYSVVILFLRRSFTLTRRSKMSSMSFHQMLAPLDQTS